MRRHNFLRLLLMVTWAAVAVPLALAGGPKYVAGVSYFNSGTAGTPLTWAQGQVNYYTDQGDLSPILPGPSADAFVAELSASGLPFPRRQWRPPAPDSSQKT